MSSRPRLHSFDVEKILNHPVHSIRGPAHDLDLSPLLRAVQRGVLEHQARRHRNGIERVAQIVRYDGQNVVARLRCLLRFVKQPRVLDHDRRASRHVGSEREIAALNRRPEPEVTSVRRAQRLA